MALTPQGFTKATSIEQVQRIAQKAKDDDIRRVQGLSGDASVDYEAFDALFRNPEQDMKEVSDKMYGDDLEFFDGIMVLANERGRGAFANLMASFHSPLEIPSVLVELYLCGVSDCRNVLSRLSEEDATGVPTEKINAVVQNLLKDMGK